jgi:hypothetical protein
MTPRPDDECPYRKPFAGDFSGCPAYQRAQFVPLDTQYRPLASIWTCGNLDFGHMPRAHWRHFARCRVGSQENRMAWVAQVREDRMAVVRAIQTEMAPMMAAQVTELWAAKGRQLAAAGDPENRDEASVELRRLTERFLTNIEAFFEDHDREMAVLSLPIDATVDLFRDLLEAWAEQPNAEVPTISEAALARFPEEARILFTPQSAA